MFTLVFGPDLPLASGLVGEWLLPAALLTLAVGAIGVLGSRQLGRLAAFSAIASMGTALSAIAMFTPRATTAAIYYIVHSTFATAMIFLVVGLVCERRGDDGLRPPVRMAQSGLIAAAFFGAAIALAGMPPLSGFVGKLLVLSAALAAPQAVWIWAVILCASLILIIGYARAGSLLFWKPFEASPTDADPGDTADPGDPEHKEVAAPVAALPFVSVFALLALLGGITVLAGPVMDYAGATAAQLYDPIPYIEAVLGRAGQ